LESPLETDTLKDMTKHNLIRLAVAAPVTGGALVILTMFVTGPRLSWTFAIVAVVGLFLLGLQTWANYYRQWYDPTLALKYLDIFCDKELIESRQKACQHYLKHKDWPLEIEDVLDVLDDLGFYVQTIHVSRDVLHQYFCWWVIGYVTLADDYIKTRRAGDSAKGIPADPTRWEHCKLLLHEIQAVEAVRLRAVGATDHKLDWTEAQKMRFLREEALEDEAP
jgi:hypothetical protein